MWKGFILQAIIVLVLWIGMQLFLDLNTNLTSQNKTAIKFTVVNGVQLIYWFISSIIFVIIECFEKISLDTFFPQFTFCNLIGMILFTILGLIYFILFFAVLEHNITIIFEITLYTCLCASVIGIVLTLIYLKRTQRLGSAETTHRETESNTGNYLGNSSYYCNSNNAIEEELEYRNSIRSKGKKAEIIMRQLPTIIYQDYHKFHITKCPICEEKFESAESCKVFPKCFHIFHTDCIKQWYGQRECCPVDETLIDHDSLQKIKSMNDEELIKRLSHS